MIDPMDLTAADSWTAVLREGEVRDVHAYRMATKAQRMDWPLVDIVPLVGSGGRVTGWRFTDPDTGAPLTAVQVLDRVDQHLRADPHRAAGIRRYVWREAFRVAPGERRRP